MKVCMFIFLSLMTGLSALAEAPINQEVPKKQSYQFNQALAKQLGADEYGMKMYVMAFLKAGPNRDRSTEEAAELQKAHMSNIKHMAENGDLVLAGPFGKNDQEMRGIYIFNATSIEEAEALTASDPAIQAGSLVMELIPWYGSAALMQVSEVHQTLLEKHF